MQHSQAIGHAMLLPAEAGVFAAEDGRRYTLGKLTMTFKRSGSSDPCKYSVCRAANEPGWTGARLPKHIYEEWHVQLEGVCSGQLGDSDIVLHPGDMVYIPPGVAHGFHPAKTAGVQLLISAPPGLFERFIADTQAFEAGERPGDSFDAILQRSGIEFLAPSWPQT